MLQVFFNFIFAAYAAADDTEPVAWYKIMMSFRLQIVIFLILILGIVYIISLIKKKSLDLRYALIWIVVSVCVLILTAFPQLLDMAAAALGIASPVNMLFFFGFCFSVMIIFSLSLALSRTTEKMKKIAQELAIMRRDMHVKFYEMEEKKDSTNKQEQDSN